MNNISVCLLEEQEVNIYTTDESKDTGCKIDFSAVIGDAYVFNNQQVWLQCDCWSV